jgi:toxin ParE1/3/4
MKLIWADSAEADLYSIAGYYAQHDPDLPDEILGRIIAAPLALLDQPRLGALVELGLRKWAVRHTPFILLYRIDVASVEVARVVHANSNWFVEP